MALMAYLAWLSGSFAGGVFADLIPVTIVNGMGIGLYALFIALLVPSARKTWQFALVALTSALVAWALSKLLPDLSEGWALIAAALGASALGIVLPDGKGSP
jgi:predicted branched-subunit amino acid permease